MKSFRFKIRPALLISLSLLGYVGYFVACTQKDQILTTGPAPVNSTNLVSLKATTPPTIDGAIDQAWDKAEKLYITPTVPDPGNGLFAGYIGEQYNVTLRSMYDANNIYFLAEISDPTQSVIVSPWYFNPTLNVAGKTTGWQKEPSSRTYDVNGVLTRAAMGEDKIAMLWNVNNSTPKFITQTCYSSCHVFTPYLDYSKTPAVMNANASGNHYTNGGAEKIDMWWGRLGYMSKDASLNFLDDNYQDWAGGPTYSDVTGGNANGRHVDGIYPNGTFSTTWPNRPNYSTSPPKQGEFSNQQSLKLDGTGAAVNVPIWVVPGAVTTGFLMASDTAGAALKVIKVSSAGVLTLSDNSTIDPTADTGYQRSGDPVTGPTAAKGIPAYVALPLLNERADITSVAVYGGSGWVVEYKRALKTGDILNQDIDFTANKNTDGSLSDQPFGVAIWNQSNNQHGIQPNLLLQFQK